MKNGKNNSSESQLGYTLMEMMVVLALIAVVVALVVPSLGRGYGNFQLRLAASSISTAFKQARTHAVYEARNYVVVFGPESEMRRDLYVVRDDGKTVDHIVLSGHLRLLAEQTRDNWAEDLRPVHFFADGRSDAMQLDVSGESGHHLQLALNPLTARARVTQLYDAQEKPVAASEKDANVIVVSGGQK